MRMRVNYKPTRNAVYVLAEISDLIYTSHDKYPVACVLPHANFSHSPSKNQTVRNRKSESFVNPVPSCFHFSRQSQFLGQLETSMKGDSGM